MLYLRISTPIFLHLVKETDKATIDVEAQEDGVMGKILVRSWTLSRSSQCH